MLLSFSSSEKLPLFLQGSVRETKRRQNIVPYSISPALPLSSIDAITGSSTTCPSALCLIDNYPAIAQSTPPCTTTTTTPLHSYQTAAAAVNLRPVGRCVLLPQVLVHIIVSPRIPHSTDGSSSTQFAIIEGKWWHKSTA